MIPEKYYSPTGIEVSRSSIVNDMITNYKSTESKITDFSEGSEIRNLLESVALSLFKLDYYTNLNLRQSFLSYAEGGYLDLFGIDRNLPRKHGKQAYGFVTVSIAEPLQYDYTIPLDTVFVNPITNIKYNIYISMNYEDSYVIPTGSTSVEIPIICSQYGKIGNTEKNTVIAFSKTPSITLSVTNNEAIHDGAEDESDADYRTRLLANVSGGNFGSKQWYIGKLKNITGVHDVYIDFAYEKVRVYVNANTKPISSELLVECLDCLNDDENHLLGHRFEVLSCDYNLVNLRCTINLEDTLLEETVRNRVQCFFDGGNDGAMWFNGLNQGEALTENGLIGAVNSLTGVASVVFEVQDQQGNYNRFSSIVNQENEVALLNNLEIVFR